MGKLELYIKKKSEEGVQIKNLSCTVSATLCKIKTKGNVLALSMGVLWRFFLEF
jgi:hypothetical protein